MCVFMYVGTYIPYMYIQRSKDNLQGSVLSLHHVASEDQIKITGLGSKCLYQLNHLIGPYVSLLPTMTWILHYFLCYAQVLFCMQIDISSREITD